ncbi:MAG: aldehyde dehydrogenase family protein, partial [Bacteroidales bacterium]
MNPSTLSVPELITLQKNYFLQGNTMPVSKRKETLKKLKSLIRENEALIAEAVWNDFRKSYFEVLSNETGLVYAEISKFLKRMNRWSRPLRSRTSLANLPGKSRVYSVPFGNVLVIGSWNYPVQLALIPVVSALAAGNTVILKPSELTSHTSGLLARIINETFSPKLFHVIEGGKQETTEILKNRFDKIFFTGSTAVGRIIMKAAAEHLTPVTLELGGKNPAIVLPDCNLAMTAKRLVWGKFHNGGQACVVPDHIYVHESVRDRLIEEVMKNIQKIFNGDPKRSEGLPRIINDANYDRLMKLINPEKTILGGNGERDELYIEPTVMQGVTAEDAVMQEEIFGPVMPFLDYSDLDALLVRLKNEPSPLAFYLFTKNLRLARKIQREFRSGGGMINDTVVHFVNGNTPFGGVGDSGMGSYHGRAGFECFSHRKTVLTKPTWFELWVKYPPFTKLKLRIVRAILR